MRNLTAPTAGGGCNSAMERDTISKNRVSPKNGKHRNHSTVMTTALCFCCTAVICLTSYRATYDDRVVINGVTWATRNVGAPGAFAANPESYGMFYQWNRNIGWNSAVHKVNSRGSKTWNSSTPTGSTWEKDNDPSPVGWRVPTDSELSSLLDETKVSNVWTTLNGVDGRKFTDKVTGNSIFLPAAGCRYHGGGTLVNAGLNGYYWSSAQHGNGSACRLDVNSSNAVSSAGRRSFGYSIRCVRE